MDAPCHTEAAAHVCAFCADLPPASPPLTAPDVFCEAAAEWDHDWIDGRCSECGIESA